VKAQKSNEFRVSINGLALSAEQREGVCRAMQQALMQALADIDFGGDRVAFALPIRDNGNGGTQGIRGGAMERSAVERLIAGEE
jgi:hypothetical protein